MTRVYVDASVFGGTQDVEFADDSLRFLEEVRKGVFVVLISPLTMGELADAPEEVSRTLFDLPPSQVESVPLSKEVLELAEEYIRTGVLGGRRDARRRRNRGGRRLDRQLEFPPHRELQTDSRFQLGQRADGLPTDYHS